MPRKGKRSVAAKMRWRKQRTPSTTLSMTLKDTPLQQEPRLQTSSPSCTDDQLMVLVKEEPWCDVDQQDPEDLHIKQEQEELHQQQIEDRDVPTSSSADQMTAETNRNPDLNPHEPTPDSSETELLAKHGLRKPATTSGSGTDSSCVLHHLDLDSMDTDDQLMVKEEPWCDVDQQDSEILHIKEEQKEVSTSLEGEQLNLKETDAARFPFTAVSTKSEDDEEKPVFSQLHQQQIEDRDVPTSSSADQMTAESSRNPDLNPHEPTPDSSETDVSGDDEKDDDDNLDSKPSFSGPEAGDGDDNWNESRSFELDVKTVNTTFSCPECGEQFLCKSSLQKHMRVTSHSAIELSGCLVNKECVGVKKLVDSSSKVQKERKSFKCDFCEKGFSYKSALINHMRSHTGEKPYACGLCGQRFSCKSSLNDHMRVHTGQKPFSCELCGKRFARKENVTNHMKVHTDRSPLPVSSVDKDLASRESTQTSSLTNGGVGSKQGELCSDPLKKTVYVILQPLNTSAEMSKITDKPIQATGEPNKEDNSRGNLNSQMTCAANIPAAPLTRADIEVMLQGLEDRITSKLSAQFTMDRALLEQQDSSIQELETSINDMRKWMSELETTCSMLIQEKKKLKLKPNDPENRSIRNNICITGLPEKAEGPHTTVFITECLTEIFGPEAFPMPLVVDVAHRIGVPRQNQKAPRPFIARVHHFHHKELILKLAQERGRLTYRGKEIHISPKSSPSLGTTAILTGCSSPQSCRSQTKLDKS